MEQDLGRRCEILGRCVWLQSHMILSAGAGKVRPKCGVEVQNMPRAENASEILTFPAQECELQEGLRRMRAPLWLESLVGGAAWPTREVGVAAASVRLAMFRHSSAQCRRGM